MSQIQKKFIANDAVDGTKVLLASTQWLRALNTSAVVTNLMRLNGSNQIEFNSLPTILSGSPASANDLVNKAYVDNLVQGIKWKTEARALAVSNVALSGSTSGLTAIFDGVTPADGDRLLLPNQTDPKQNGLYQISITGGVYSLSRTLDMDASLEFPSAWIPVAEGTLWKDTIWGCTVDAGFILGTNNATFTKLLTLQDLIAGLGLAKSGNTLDVQVDTLTNTLVINGSNQVAVKIHSTGAIETHANGLRVKIEASNPTLQIDGSNQLGVKLNPGGAIITSASGIGVKLEATNPTLQIDGSNQLGAKLDPAGAVITGTAGLKVKLEAATPTLQIDGSNQLGAKLNPAGAIVTSATGLQIQLEASNPTLIIASNRIGVKYSTTASGLDQDANGLKVKQDATNLTTKIDASGQVTTPIQRQVRLTLAAGDITNQFVDLAHLAEASSVRVFVAGVYQRPGLDFTISAPGSVTRVTFAGDLSTGGNAALVSGDVLEVIYRSY